jgi:hypothetical protein
LSLNESISTIFIELNQWDVIHVGKNVNLGAVQGDSFLLSNCCSVDHRNSKLALKCLNASNENEFTNVKVGHPQR